MIGQMPTQQVIAMLKAARPAQALGILSAMPIDRITHITTSMEPADLTAMLLALPPHQRVELLAMIPADHRPYIFSRLSMRQFADLLPAVTPDIAAQMLADVPTAAAAELLSDMPPSASARLLPLLPEGDAVVRAMYERRARESVVRAAPNVSWLDQRSCDIAADVFGRRVQVAIRFVPDIQPMQVEVDGSVRHADWTIIAGMLIVTNVRPNEPALLQAKHQQRAGRRVELVRWADERDDGVLKRALVRLAG